MVDIDELREKARLALVPPLESDIQTPGWLQKVVDARHDLMACVPALLDELATLRDADKWLDVADAPCDIDLYVRAGGMTFKARLLLDRSMRHSGEWRDQWVASIEGEHPPCWTEGACWQSNEDEVGSLRPTHYRLLPAPPKEI